MVISEAKSARETTVRKLKEKKKEKRNEIVFSFINFASPPITFFYVVNIGFVESLIRIFQWQNQDP